MMCSIQFVFRLKISLSAHVDKLSFATLAVQPLHSMFLMSPGQRFNEVLLRMRYIYLTCCTFGHIIAILYNVQFQKISILPSQKGIWNFLGGSVRPNNLKKCMKLNWNFLRGGGSLKKSLLCGEIWIFSGITQWGKCWDINLWRTSNRSKRSGNIYSNNFQIQDPMDLYSWS